jgi:3'(2'), 5'-bisphosphate nucleotidase
MKDIDDHEAAVRFAELAGARLLQVRDRARREGIAGSELKDLGDRAAQTVLARALADEVPGDAVLSEEAADDHARLGAERVWIIDPLDGTREFSEDGRDDWAVHVALWVRGELTAGAVALPARSTTYGTGQTHSLPSRPVDSPLRLAVSRSRPPEFVTALAERLEAELVPMGSAGVKAMSVLDGQCDAYVHAGGQYEWDSAAPVAVARAAGLHTSRIDGGALEYNNESPYLPDLVIARPEVAPRLLRTLADRVRAKE